MLKVSVLPQSASRHQAILLALALLLSLWADYYLVITGQYLPGVALFCMVQVCYHLYLTTKPAQLRRWFVQALLPTFLCLCVLVYFQSFAWVPALALFYFFLLLENVLDYQKAHTQRPLTALWGMNLLFLCDIHVALSNLSTYIALDQLPLLKAWSLVGHGLLWVFYIPAQGLMCFTLFKTLTR